MVYLGTHIFLFIYSHFLAFATALELISNYTFVWKPVALIAPCAVVLKNCGRAPP